MLQLVEWSRVKEAILWLIIKQSFDGNEKQAIYQLWSLARRTLDEREGLGGGGDGGGG